MYERDKPIEIEARACLLTMLGSTLYLDESDSRMGLGPTHEVCDIKKMGTCSWGSVVLVVLYLN